MQETKAIDNSLIDSLSGLVQREVRNYLNDDNIPTQSDIEDYISDWMDNNLNRLLTDKIRIAID